MHLTHTPCLGVVKDTPNEAIASYDLSWITTGLNASFGRNPRYCCCDGCFDNGHLGQVLNQTGHSDVLLMAGEKHAKTMNKLQMHPPAPMHNAIRPSLQILGNTLVIQISGRQIQ